MSGLVCKSMLQGLQHCADPSPNWASQLSSLHLILSWKLRRHIVRWPGRHRSTIKWPLLLPEDLAWSLYSSYADCICAKQNTLLPSWLFVVSEALHMCKLHMLSNAEYAGACTAFSKLLNREPKDCSDSICLLPCHQSLPAF